MLIGLTFVGRVDKMDIILRLAWLCHKTVILWERLYYKIDVIKERIDEWKIKQDGIICIGNNIREVRKSSGMKQKQMVSELLLISVWRNCVRLLKLDGKFDIYKH